MGARPKCRSEDPEPAVSCRCSSSALRRYPGALTEQDMQRLVNISRRQFRCQLKSASAQREGSRLKSGNQAVIAVCRKQICPLPPPKALGYFAHLQACRDQENGVVALFLCRIQGKLDFPLQVTRLPDRLRGQANQYGIASPNCSGDLALPYLARKEINLIEPWLCSCQEQTLMKFANCRLVRRGMA